MRVETPSSESRQHAEVLIFVSREMLPKVRLALAPNNLPKREVHNLRDALRVLATQPRLVITKIDEAGFELFRTAREYYPATKVVMLEEEDYARSSSVGD